MTHQKILAALLFSAAVVSPAINPALAAAPVNCAVCACPPAKKPVAAHRAAPRPVRHAAAVPFYDYGAAHRVGDRFRAAWVEAPHDGHVAYDGPPPAAYAGNTQGGYYGGAYAAGGYADYGDNGYAQNSYGYVHNPDLDRGWTGGVGYMGDQNGGGGGGGGTAILAGGQNGNGPTYNSYGQSFPYGGADTYAAQTNANWRNSSIPIKQGN